jgi:hypothetical protein
MFRIGRIAAHVLVLVAAVAAVAAFPGVAAASPPESEGCKNPHQPGVVYAQRCVGVSLTGSVGTAQARADSYLTAWENAFSVSCSRDEFDVIPRDNGAVQVNIYATCYPFA